MLASRLEGRAREEVGEATTGAAGLKMAGKSGGKGQVVVFAPLSSTPLQGR